MEKIKEEIKRSYVEKIKKEITRFYVEKGVKPNALILGLGIIHILQETYDITSSSKNVLYIFGCEIIDIDCCIPNKIQAVLI